MKKVLLVSSLIGVFAFGLLPNQKALKVSATSGHVINTNGTQLVSTLPTTIDLNPVDTNDVRDYYKSLNSLPESERQGTNLLKNLKPILKEMNYFKYGGMSTGGVTHIYTITDRDWVNSPASEIEGYNASTNTITSFSHKEEVANDPYVHMLYVDYSGDVKTPFKNPNKKSNPNFDKEHVWCQSRGFKALSAESESAMGPAGTDLHHLIAGDSMVNQDVHNDIPYGFVNTTQLVGDQSTTANNKNGTPKHTSVDDEYNQVFEPQDSDKGDIARAIFYMAARYNNLSGTDTITNYEPNLTIVNHISGSGKAVYSTATSPVSMGILSDLLAWNKLDPVDEYEIHRNDLIYRNYQGNRNPFIDFPQWADYIWGTVDNDGTNYNPTISGRANPANDRINDSGLSVSRSSFSLAPNETAKVKAVTIDNSDITWSVSDDSIIELSKLTSHSDEEIDVKALKVGKVTITVKATVDSEEITKTITINVAETPKPNYLLYIAIGVGVVVVIIIVIVIYVNGSKKTRKTIKKAAKTITKSYTGSSKKKTSSTKKKARK